jgi:hypothetical protein
VFGLRLRSGVKPAIGLKTPRLTVGLKFRSDKNISKWPPRRLLLPILAGKCPPLCSTSGGSETLLRIRSLAGSVIDTLESSFQKGHLHGPRGFPFGRLSWWPRLVGDRYDAVAVGTMS